VWQQFENGRVVHRYEWIVLAATLAVIPVLVIEIDVESAASDDICRPRWQQ
jgi:hypothetical protein